MTPLELKTAFRVLNEEVTALRNRVGALEAEKAQTVEQMHEVVRQLIDSSTGVEKPNRKMCPHCGEQPAYHFHVIKCAKIKRTKA